MRDSRSYKGTRRSDTPRGRAQSPYENYRSRSSRKTGASFRHSLSLMLLLFVIVLGVILVIGGIQNKNGNSDTFFGALFAKLTNKESSKSIDFSLPFGPHRENILLLGVDSNGADSDLWVGTRTDTIILMNVDPRTKTVNAISIPRDSKVYLPDGMGTQKINAAHAIGGIKMTVQTIEETLGVKIDRYIMFHDAGVRAIVKALGGVDIYVEKNMKYDDNAGKLHINITKGKHHLTDKDVVEYLRFRHDAMGDIGRTKRQQWFLRGLLADLKKPETLVKIPKLVSVANKYVKTDMTPYEMSQYAALATHFDMDNIEIAMLPGAPNKHGYISYWILDPEKTQQVIDRLIYRKKFDGVKEEYTASIMSSSKRKEEAAKLKNTLDENGIKVICSGTSSSTHSQFIAHSKYVTIDYYADLKSKVPQVKSKQFVYEPSNYQCAKSDFTIVLADEN
ncbi:LCP family protein [bacterium]|nr:LCP family protein [bacterium]